jgi:hypothetical protein
VAGEVHDVRVTVRWLETRSEPEDPDSNFVHLCCEVWPGNDSDGTLADRWQMDWYHFVSMFGKHLRDYLEEYCPFPEQVLECLNELTLPEELQGILGVVPEIEA